MTMIESDRPKLRRVCVEQGDTLLHPPLRVFLEEGGGGFPSRMLTRWVSGRDDQGRTSNSRSFLSIRAMVSPIRLVVAGHLRNMWVSSPRTPCW